MANQSVEDFKRRIAQVPLPVRKAATDAINKSADRMTSAMRAAVPVEHGKLKSTIRKIVEPELARVTIVAGGKETTVPVRSGASASYDYALAQEFGTEKMPANPFFWGSYRLYRKQWKAAAKRAMKKAIGQYFDIK